VTRLKLTLKSAHKMKSNNQLNFLECKVALLGATLGLTVLLLNRPALAGPEPLSGKDKNVAVPQEVVPFNWSGFYIGGNLGGNWTNSDFGHHFTDIASEAIEDDAELHTPAEDDFDPDDEDRGTLFSPDSNSSNISFLGGGQLGYQHQFGHIVIGVEGDFDGATGNSDAPTVTSSLVQSLNDDFESVESVLDSQRRTEVNWQASLRGRLGYAHGRFLFYATGGAAWADVETSAHDTITTHVFDTFGGVHTEEEGGVQIHSRSGHDDDTLLGWTAGAGAEYALCNVVTLGIEYRHNDFGSETFQFDKVHDGYVHLGNTRLGLSGDQVTMRINILLGRIGLRK
jgi:outer membrane immunogenic protein